jgi:hypothetical protein
MKCLSAILLLIALILLSPTSHAQKINGEIFIPMGNRTDIWMKPRMDTLDNKKEYEFRIRVSPDFTISQFLFEKGLAVQTDSVLAITPNSTNWGGFDTASLKVIVTSIRGSHIMLFQKQFIVRVPDKMYPVISNPKTNVIMANDKIELERNASYSKELFTTDHPFITMYDNEKNMQKVDVKGVTVALMKKEGKQYISKGDSISTEAIHELRKIKKETPVYIRVEGQLGKSHKTVWNRIMVYNP